MIVLKIKITQYYNIDLNVIVCGLTFTPKNSLFFNAERDLWNAWGIERYNTSVVTHLTIIVFIKII